MATVKEAMQAAKEHCEELMSLDDVVGVGVFRLDKSTDCVVCVYVTLDGRSDIPTSYSIKNNKGAEVEVEVKTIVCGQPALAASS